MRRTAFDECHSPGMPQERLQICMPWARQLSVARIQQAVVWQCCSGKLVKSSIADTCVFLFFRVLETESSTRNADPHVSRQLIIHKHLRCFARDSQVGAHINRSAVGGNVRVPRESIAAERPRPRPSPGCQRYCDTLRGRKSSDGPVIGPRREAGIFTARLRPRSYFQRRDIDPGFLRRVFGVRVERGIGEENEPRLVRLRSSRSCWCRRACRFAGKRIPGFTMRRGSAKPVRHSVPLLCCNKIKIAGIERGG